MPAETQHAAQGVFAFPAQPGSAVKLDLCTGKADPLHDTAQKQAFFFELQDFTEYLVVEEPEVGHTGSQFDTAQI